VQNALGGPNPIRKADGEAEVAALRQQFNIPAAQNVAYAEVAVDAHQDELIAVSGGTSPAGAVPTPASRLFDTVDTPPGHYRGNDAEVKLLEAVARAIEPNAQKGQCHANRTGAVRLYSHFTICPSCLGVIAAFGAMFPGVVLSYSDGT
jgi:putative deaminase of polymorphic toxin system